MLYGVPIILLTALPVTIFAGFVTRLLKGFSRLAVNFIIHIGSAIFISQFLFKEFNEFASISIVVAAIFFTFDELSHFAKKRNKGLLSVTPIVILFITLVPSWMHNHQVSQELEEIDRVGFPSPVIMINEREVEVDDPVSRYSSTGIGETYEILEPYILPKGILEDPQYDVHEINGGDTISLSFDQKLNENYTAELTYLLDGTMFTERISDTNNEFIVPDNLEPQAIAIDGVWTRYQVSFHIMIN
jgi:hypothetical protein